MDEFTDEGGRVWKYIDCVDQWFYGSIVTKDNDGKMQLCDEFGDLWTYVGGDLWRKDVEPLIKMRVCGIPKSLFELKFMRSAAMGETPMPSRYQQWLFDENEMDEGDASHQKKQKH
jgi:hypothetical protein